MDDIFVPIAFFFSIVAIAKIIADSRTRNKLVDRGVSAEEARALLGSHGMRQSSLKWGLVTVGIGLGLVVVQLVNFEEGGPIVAGIVLLFAGAGLLAHYLLADRGSNTSFANGPFYGEHESGSGSA